MDHLLHDVNGDQTALDVSYMDNLPFSVSPVTTEYTTSANSGVEEYTEGDFENQLLHLASTTTNGGDLNISNLQHDDEVRGGADFDIAKFLVFNADEKPREKKSTMPDTPANKQENNLAYSSSTTHVSEARMEDAHSGEVLLDFPSPDGPCSSPASMMTQGKDTRLKEEEYKDLDGDMDIPLIGRGSAFAGRRAANAHGKRSGHSSKKKSARKSAKKGKQKAAEADHLIQSSACHTQLPSCPQNVCGDIPIYAEALTDAAILALKPKKLRKKAKFDKPSPSRFCHICSRTPKNVRLAVCKKISDGICRKVVCEKCFADYQFGDFDEALQKINWLCSHCSGKCPERAQCQTYGRINDKLRATRLKQLKAARRLGFQNLPLLSPGRSQSCNISDTQADLAQAFLSEFDPMILSDPSAFTLEGDYKSNREAEGKLDKQAGDSALVSTEHPLQGNVHTALSLQQLLEGGDDPQLGDAPTPAHFLGDMTKFLPGLQIPEGTIGKSGPIDSKRKERRGRKPGSGKKKRSDGAGPSGCRGPFGVSKGAKKSAKKNEPKMNAEEAAQRIEPGTDMTMPYDMMLAADDVFSHDFVGLGENAIDPLQDNVFSDSFTHDGSEEIPIPMIEF